jgi:uncharacterized protein
MKIILDTNFLLVPNQFGVDIFEYLSFYKIAVLSSCMDELRALAKKKGSDGKAAKIGLKLIEHENIEIIKTREKGDDSIVSYATAENCAVATNDKALIARLKKNGIKILRLKQKKYVVED